MIVVNRSRIVSAARGTSQVLSDRPQAPKQNQVWTDPDTGDQEMWNGAEWTSLTKLDQIFARFGLGSDGDVAITSGTTKLTQDMFYNNLSISSGATLDPAGYRVFCRGTLTNNGNIDVSAAVGLNGTNGSDGVFGRGGSAGSDVLGYLISIAGGAGGGGAIGNDPNPGSNGAASTLSLGSAAAGGNGGAGGGGGSGSGAGDPSGGTGGTVSAAAAEAGSVEDPEQAILFRTLISGQSPTSWGVGGGGAGGGGGSGDNTSGGGGGGGGGASALPAVIVAAIISGTGTVTGIGGDGGDGGDGTDGDTGGGGGGGAAQGGFVFLIFSRKEDFAWTTTLTGGIGGTGGAAGGSGAAGTDGSDGSNGVLYEYMFS